MRDFELNTSVIAGSMGEARKQILEIARNRPGTLVAKCIQAYEEQQELASLIILLEELSKNTDYSTDLRISLGYYIDELLRHCVGDKHVSRRSAIVAAGSALQYCGKVYGDRVEYMYQVVEHQIEALLTSESQKEQQPNGSNDPDNNASKPEEPRKRRAKKLTKKEVDPYLLTIEPKKFKTMSEEKRFSSTGFVKCMRNRTIEYLYQDHTPPNLWRHAPIIDPHNPLDLDEKKQYKMFTYYVEHRYNTLLPDIPFERLNLIKEYVHTNQVNTAEILNEHMTTKDYLDEYIALENQMLASRYGATLRTRRRIGETAKRTLPDILDTDSAKKGRMEEDHPMEEDETEDELPSQVEPLQMDHSTTEDIDKSLVTGEALQNQISVDSGLGESINASQQDSAFNSSQDESQVESSKLSESQVDSSMMVDSSLSTSQVENSTLSESQMENPPFSSTLAMNESSMIDSTRLNLTTANDDPKELDLIHSGLGMDYRSDSLLKTGQSSDDEGIVLSDLEDQRLLSPKVMVNDILPGEPAHPTECIATNAEEDVNVPIEVCYPIELNMFGIPQKYLRKKRIFKLTSEFDLFMQAVSKSIEPSYRICFVNIIFCTFQRLPTKRDADTRPARVVPQRKEKEAPQIQDDVSLEFDVDMNFLGFRRPTMDSGFAWSAAVSTVGETKDVKVEVEDRLENTECPEEVLSPDAEPVESAVQSSTKGGESIRSKTGLEATELAAMESGLLATTTETQLETSTNSGDESGVEATIISGMDCGLGATITSDINNTTEADASQIDKETPYSGMDSGLGATISSIRDWHIKLAPALEAAHDRQNFNIKDLGTEILNVCQAGNGRATLQDVMADKDPSIMCRYMLASLVLTNHGNVSLNFGNIDKSKPIEMSQFCMQLKSTKRMEIHPEDDVGNIRAVQAKCKQAAMAAKRKSTEAPPTEGFAKTVRLIRPVPKVYQSPDDADSGVSSLHSSVASTSLE
ncbi:hypothetical protein KR009_004837 [Drosophila setifemur]|nr:hypothetical protein KR009_004837 [Drosophila setifemur]